MCTSGGKRGPNPRFSPPRPRIFGDGAGMGTWYEKTLGIFWGRGWVENWGFFGVLSPKIPKDNLGIFWGRGWSENWGFFGDFIPENPQK